jgi:hypothetical protein
MPWKDASRLAQKNKVGAKNTIFGKGIALFLEFMFFSFFIKKKEAKRQYYIKGIFLWHVKNLNVKNPM